MFAAAWKDRVCARVPYNEGSCLCRSCFNEVILYINVECISTRCLSGVEVISGTTKYLVVSGEDKTGRLAQREWMRVSVALRFNRLLLASPGRPYMMAQLTLLVSLI